MMESYIDNAKREHAENVTIHKIIILSFVRVLALMRVINFLDFLHSYMSRNR